MNKKNKTLQRTLVKSYTSFFILFSLIPIIIFFLVIDNLTVNNKITNFMATTEKSADDVSYILQQDINLALGISSSSDVQLDLRDFGEKPTGEQLDIDTELTKSFENYWLSHSEISKIKIYLPNDIASSDISFKSIAYLSDMNDTEWEKYFQADSSVMISEYSCSSNIYNTELKKDSSKLAIILPIKNGQTTVAFLNMDIDKNTLYSKYFDNSSLVVINSKGGIVSNQNNVDIGKKSIDEFVSKLGTSYSTIKINNVRYLAVCTEVTRHNFRFITYMPYQAITSHRIIYVVIFIGIAIVLFILAFVYAKKRTVQITEPFKELRHAMNSSKPANINVGIDEFNTLYSAYNNLLEENNKMLAEEVESSKKQRELEQQALLSQISPHFLYNTLNVIVWKAAKANQGELCGIISKLAKLCQISYKTKTDFTDLKTEINHIELYMQLQVECFKNRFDFSIDLPTDLEYAQVPRFILQPLVENSIIHGFSQMVESGHISVVVSADEDLTITIQDNGSGITADILEKLNNNTYITERYGLKNIKQRIALLCGDEYGIKFDSNAHNKTVATITLPLRYN